MHQNTPAYQIFTFYLEKYQSYKAFHVSHDDTIMTPLWRHASVELENK